MKLRVFIFTFFLFEWNGSRKKSEKISVNCLVYSFFPLIAQLQLQSISTINGFNLITHIHHISTYELLECSAFRFFSLLFFHFFITHLYVFIDNNKQKPKWNDAVFLLHLDQRYHLYRCIFVFAAYFYHRLK